MGKRRQEIRGANSTRIFDHCLAMSGNGVTVRGAGKHQSLRARDHQPADADRSLELAPLLGLWPPSCRGGVERFLSGFPSVRRWWSVSTRQFAATRPLESGTKSRES
ncbi:MAG: hypothetical protein ACKO3P_09710, partial [Planctomycetaceae bacterium]